MFFFYPMLIIGALLGIGAVIALLAMYKDKNYTLMRFGKSIASLLIGFLLLYMTLPSLKYVVFKEYDVVRGKCVIEIDSATRSSTVDFTMLESDEIFSFRDIPDLDAYGKAVPYYCEVTVTKDHMFEVGYKLYDDKTRKLLETSD